MGAKVLSLYDGISCGMLALLLAGIVVDSYYASEIDEDAILVSKSNFNNIIHIGDVKKVSYKDGVLYTENGIFETGLFDIIIGGSPCQGFSFAGNQLNFDDPRSKLLFEFVRLRKETNTAHFFLENVAIKKQFRPIVSELLSCEPLYINSEFFGPGKRKRLYWTNIPLAQFPEKNAQVLSDILEYGENIISDLFLKPHELERAKEKYKTKIWKSGFRMGNMQFPDNHLKKSKCIPATVIKAARETVHIIDGGGIRILTPTEYESLQAIPKNYTEVLSAAKRYKVIGNAWHVRTICHLFSPLKHKFQNA